MNNIVIGRRADGSTVYYTGKAGQAFISPERADAFEYETIEAARRRAKNLNVGTPLHGIRFIAPWMDAAPDLTPSWIERVDE